MKTLARSLQDYPPAMLRAIAETTGVTLTSNLARRMVEEVTGFLQQPGRLDAQVAACSPAAREALAVLLRSEGRSLRLAFERQYGVIRAMGPGRLERERPHLAPINPSEELWYRGLIFSAFAETPSGMAEFLYIPGDIASLLPPPKPAPAGLRVPACPPPDAVQPANDFLLHDICTLLCLVQAGEVHLVDGDDPISWQRTSLYELSRILLQPAAALDESLRDGPGSPAALALTLVNDLGWLRPRGRRRLALHAASVRTWLESPRDQQRRIVREAWQTSQSWNDLCRTPGLACEDTGNWHNDPIATRERLLPLLAQLEPGAWTTLDALVAAVKTTAPDFQRPDGDYDTWYIRERDSQTYLRGFDCWGAVEGALLRFLITGPLHWLGAVNLGLAAQPSFSLSTTGYAWLTAQPSPTEFDLRAPYRSSRLHHSRSRRCAIARPLRREPLHFLGAAHPVPTRSRADLLLPHHPEWPATRCRTRHRRLARPGLPARTLRRATARLCGLRPSTLAEPVHIRSNLSN